MGAQRLKVVIDYRTITLFLESIRATTAASTSDIYPDSEKDSARLLVMLSSIGEFRAMTSASQIERLCETLDALDPENERNAAILAKIEEAVEALPVEPMQAARPLSMKSELPYDLRVLVACAETAHANVVVSPLASRYENRLPNLLSPAEFFVELKERYGLDYAELRF